jgi:hypothetical protein
MLHILGNPNEVILFHKLNIYSTPDDLDLDTPTRLSVQDLLATTQIEGYGDHVSKFLADVAEVPWVNWQFLEIIISHIKNLYPENDINWEETLSYLNDSFE